MIHRILTILFGIMSLTFGIMHDVKKGEYNNLINAFIEAGESYDAALNEPSTCKKELKACEMDLGSRNELNDILWNELKPMRL